MIYAFLFIAAFLFFVADRKVRLAILPGIIVTLMACFAVIWGSITMYCVRRGANAFPPDFYRLIRGNMQMGIAIIAIPIIIIMATTCIVAFLFLGKAIGKALFNPAKDGKGYNTISRIIYIAASVLTAIAGFYFILVTFLVRIPDPRMVNAVKSIYKIFGSIGFRMEGATAFGIIAMLIGILCAILICTKIPFFRTLKPEDPKKIERLKKSGKNPFAIIGFALSGIGILGTLITALDGIISHNLYFYFYGYTSTLILGIAILVFLVLGMAFLGIGMDRIKYQKTAGSRLAFLVLSLILIIMALICSCWMVISAIMNMTGR